MIKTLLILVFMLGSQLLFAQSHEQDHLKMEGRTLANYKTCADIAKGSQYEVMHSYYHDMYKDMLDKVKLYTPEESIIVDNAYELSLIEFTKLSRQSLAVFCDSRLDDLTRKMQEKKIHSQ